MLLPVQIQSILYHFLMGWVYGLGFSFLLNFVKYMHVSFLRGTMEILFHVPVSYTHLTLPTTPYV